MVSSKGFFRATAAVAVTCVLATTMVVASLLGSHSPEASAQDLNPNLAVESTDEKLPPPSGIFDFRDAQEPVEPGAERGLRAAAAEPGRGTNITECPQAGLRGGQPQPLDRRATDPVEQLSNGGDDVRVNQDRSCFPQNETSIAVNPTTGGNLLAGANDYRLGFASSGFYASTDGGRSFYDGILPFPSLPNGDNLDGGGDPAVAFDRDGVGYYAEINFNRTDDTNGVFVLRSTNGGFSWSRPCVPIDLTPADPTDDRAACGGAGDPRQPGDNVVTFQQDNDTSLNGSVPFNDKEYIAVGPRPEGVDPQCFGPTSGNQVPCDPGVVGSDRIYVTWTRFTATPDAQIYLSYSDDEARSWSPEKPISGSAPFCTGTNCDLNQFSTPTVNPETGFLYVAFENFNTPDEHQYLLVRSRDGGNTFEGPFFVTPVFDVNYPRSGAPPAGNRPDCADRGQQNGRAVLTNSCFRVNSAGNVVVDSRGGDYADDLYLVLSDNRNGTRASTNTDVFLFKSTDGGSTWVGPTRVNNDRSDLGEADRDGVETGNFGNDQWFPWVDIGPEGELNVVFHDRRLDENSEESEWPQSRSRPGNYLAWFWGAQCLVTEADSRQCVAPEAQTIEQPTEPINPGAGPVPGQDQENFPLKNFGISSVPSNMDYSFRAGIFMGDYNNVAVSRNAYGFWTDARNGRSSREQFGRNPACEQADVFLDGYSARNGRSGSEVRPTDELFLRTECAGARGGAG